MNKQDRKKIRKLLKIYDDTEGNNWQEALEDLLMYLRIKSTEKLKRKPIYKPGSAFELKEMIQ